VCVTKCNYKCPSKWQAKVEGKNSMWPQRQSSELCRHKSRNASSHQELEEVQ
jgi:hypothetical protein